MKNRDTVGVRSEDQYDSDMVKRKRTRMKTDVKGEWYVDNVKLTAELSEYAARCRKASKAGKPRPQMSEYLGQSILLISQRLGFSPNFSGYTYLEDMIGEGVENCCKYAHNFDPKISSNAFAYLTQICWFSYIRKIGEEKKQAYIRYRAMGEANICGLYQAAKHKGDLHESDPQRKFLDHLQLSASDIRKYEKMIGRDPEAAEAVSPVVLAESKQSKRKEKPARGVGLLCD